MKDDNKREIECLEAEIVPPEGVLTPNGEQSLAQNFLAISNYTDRPDLFLAEIEKHDPGFIKRMNADAEINAKRDRDARFHFGKHQAYAALGLAVVAGLAVLALFFYAISKGAGFFPLMALVVLYAVTQGGPAGFMRLIEGAIHYFKSRDDRAEPPSGG